MNARLHDGWLVVPYGGHDLARVYICAGQRQGDWRPAFLDRVDGQRVAKIRPAGLSGVVWVWLKVGGTVSQMGKVTV